MHFHKAEKYITELLQSGLPDSLFYHDYHHTMDVLKAVTEIAQAEQVSDEEMTLLKTAALFHDSGFVHVYQNHEEEGCRIAQEQLPSFDYSAEQIGNICTLIMATKTPPNPKTLLEKILCDADLYYLGTDAFESGALKLFNEWKERGKIHSEKEWIDIQINFLESHRYFTPSAIAGREGKKREHLRKLKEMVV